MATTSSAIQIRRRPPMATMSDEQMKKRWGLDVMAAAERNDPVNFDPNDEYHWESMAYGFFLALGADPERARRLARQVPT
jgi:hypothetical protein